MLAVAVSARAPTADPRIEVTLSPRLRTPPLPVTPAGVTARWRNIGKCRKTSLPNALQVEKMLRIARNGTETGIRSLYVEFFRDYVAEIRLSCPEFCPNSTYKRNS